MAPDQGNNAPGKGEPDLRLFVAIPLWGPFRERNQTHLQNLKKIPADLRWVNPQNWHITLKFLGRVPASRVPDLTQSLKESLTGQWPFSFELGGLGGFPRLSKCRVLWVGATDGKRELIDLANRVAEACTQAGFPGDKKNFQAHLTLARTRKKSLAIRVPKEQFEASWGEVRVDSVVLVKSSLQPGGAKYEVVETVSF